jgi:N6-L-threonylcarbamoyladenine synthase
MNVLGIESSCDETAAALVRDGRRLLSSVVASQTDVHHRFGGVVPELASRRHLEAIAPVVREALSQAGFELAGVDGLAATQGPGLIGSLLIGFSFAKAVAYSLGVPGSASTTSRRTSMRCFWRSGRRSFPLSRCSPPGGTPAFTTSPPF